MKFLSLLVNVIIGSQVFLGRETSADCCYPRYPCGGRSHPFGTCCEDGNRPWKGAGLLFCGSTDACNIFGCGCKCRTASFKTPKGKIPCGIDFITAGLCIAVLLCLWVLLSPVLNLWVIRWIVPPKKQWSENENGNKNHPEANEHTFY